MGEKRPRLEQSPELQQACVQHLAAEALGIDGQVPRDRLGWDAHAGMRHQALTV